MNARVTESARVLVTIEGNVGRIVLDRPEALNAVDGAMFETIYDTLAAWRDDPRIEAVTIAATGRAFCAGGDVRAVRDAVLAGDATYNERLYATEYRTNALIAEYPKPYIALIDGYCMGGGVGLAVHGSYRIATSNAVFAMPETAIGYFPDIGCSYLLPRIPEHIGVAVGLLGLRLSAADAVACGIVTHVVAPGALAETERRVLAGEAIDTVLAALAIPPGAAPIDLQRAQISRAFAPRTLRGMVAMLETDDSDWARATLATLRERSPAALCVTLAMFELGRTRSLRACLAMELAVSRFMLQRPDFREGVRAVVIDKDRAPRWTPATIETLDERELQALVDAAARAVDLPAA